MSISCVNNVLLLFLVSSVDKHSVFEDKIIIFQLKVNERRNYMILRILTIGDQWGGLQCTKSD